MDQTVHIAERIHEDLPAERIHLQTHGKAGLDAGHNARQCLAQLGSDRIGSDRIGLDRVGLGGSVSQHFSPDNLEQEENFSRKRKGNEKKNLDTYIHTYI